MPTFTELKAAADSAGQVRKVLEAVAFWMPMSSELPTALLDANKSLLEMPEGAVPLGMVNKEGYKFATEVNKEDTDAFGYGNPVRTDIDKAPKTIEFSLMQDGRQLVASLVYGLDLSAVPTLATGEVVFDEPPIPIMEEGRLLLIGRDGVGLKEQFRGRGYPRVKLAEVPEEAWATDNPVMYPLKLDVLIDDQVGTPCRHYLGGKGFDATALGWQPVTAP
ncbi:hypothetical protein [Janibacter sp. GS2]|uniref:hypothetical protein n=1 Tax=Janibacter sp. GS2 TaxID=3442646 RepID=UPI003EBC2A81